MKTRKVLEDWRRFSQALPKIHHNSKMMVLNFDFDLGATYEKKDYDRIMKWVDEGLVALDAIMREIA